MGKPSAYLSENDHARIILTKFVGEKNLRTLLSEERQWRVTRKREGARAPFFTSRFRIKQDTLSIHHFQDQTYIVLALSSDRAYTLHGPGYWWEVLLRFFGLRQVLLRDKNVQKLFCGHI